MTVRLDPATRRKVERLAARKGISLNEALNLLLRQAPDAARIPARRRRYRLRPRRVGFGFDIADARRLAGEISDDRTAEKLGSTAVKIPDVQILFYAIDPTSDLHEPARHWLEEAINGREEVGLAWPTILQFLRLGTHPRFPGCMSDGEAISRLRDWFDAGVHLVSDSDVSWGLFSELALASDRSLRNAIDDAHLAAIAISTGATLASFDDDFRAFVSHGLRWERVGGERL